MAKKMYTVYIRRVETYDLPYNVMAENEDEARDIVKGLDEDNEFIDWWNELQPYVETSYDAEEADGNVDREGVRC